MPPKTLAAVPTPANQLAVATERNTARVVESLVLRGDISALTPEEKAAYYTQRCLSLGLDPASKPFAILRLNGKEILYAEKGAADQLAKLHKVNRKVTRGPEVIDIAGKKQVLVIVEASMPDGRVEMDLATVPLADPDNVFMKVISKAKRRATLSILGLGMLDRDELDTIPASAKSPAPGGIAGQVPQGPEMEAEATPVTALDYLRDDLASAETLDAVRAVWGDHSGPVARMDDDGALGAARRALCERVVELGLARSSTEADALLKNPERPALLTDYERSVDATSESEAPARAIVAAWVAWRERVSKLPAPYAGHAKRYAVQAYSAALAVDEKEGAKQLAAAIKKHDAPPPDGSDPTKAAKPRSVPANDAQGSSSESAGAAGSTAHLGDLSAESPRRTLPESERYMASSAAWEENCGEHRSTFALLNSWAKHCPGLRRAGVARERLDTSIARYITVALSEGRTADETSAERRFADAERAADYEAAHPTPKARRAERTNIERPLRKVA